MRGLGKVGVAYEKIPHEKWAGLMKSGQGLEKVGVAYVKNNLRLRGRSDESIRRSLSFHNDTKGVS